VVYWRPICQSAVWRNLGKACVLVAQWGGW